MAAGDRAKPICFYLPQFHRMPENDLWWGEGFTEWTLVDAARPLYPGHRQPLEPHADIGRYDLTDPSVRRRQAETARRFGIHGFCYYHYWFSGKRLLHRPLELMLEDGYPDLPFCLCWANEPWSRRWSGEDREVLQPQQYGDEGDWAAHFDELGRFFRHPQYIRVAGCPMLLIYRIGHIDRAREMVALWRRLALEVGFEGLHIVAVSGAFADNRETPAFVDAAVDHHPSCVQAGALPLVYGGLRVIPVEEIWKRDLERPRAAGIRYAGACHAWDNTPRRGRDGLVVLPSRPERYTRHLAELFRRAQASGHEPFVFINAWNEWSEGACLEPERRHGYRWLRCVADALEGGESGESPTPRSVRTATGAGADDAAPVGAGSGPDIDLVNAFVMHGAHGATVVDVGCRCGRTAERIGLFAGASTVIGLESDPALRRQAACRLHRSLPLDAENLPGNLVMPAADHLLCASLIGMTVDPLDLLRSLAPMVADDGLAWFGFRFDGHYSMPGSRPAGAGGDGNGRPFSLAEARALVTGAGYTVERTYRVFGPRPARYREPAPLGNVVDIGGRRFDALSAAEVDDLFCLRFFVLARPLRKGRGREG